MSNGDYIPHDNMQTIFWDENKKMERIIVASNQWSKSRLL